MHPQLVFVILYYYVGKDMKLSPLDIEHQEFQSAINGYNRQQVREFLQQVAHLYEQRIQEVRAQRQQLKEKDTKRRELELVIADLQAKLKRVLMEHQSSVKAHTGTLAQEKEALTQFIAREKDKAKYLLLEAKRKAEQHLEAAQRRKEEVEREELARRQGLEELERAYQELEAQYADLAARGNTLEALQEEIHRLSQQKADLHQSKETLREDIQHEIQSFWASFSHIHSHLHTEADNIQAKLQDMLHYVTVGGDKGGVFTEEAPSSDQASAADSVASVGHLEQDAAEDAELAELESSLLDE